MKEIYNVQGNETIGYRIAVPTRLKKSDRYRIDSGENGVLVYTPVNKKKAIAKAKKAVDGV